MTLGHPTLFKARERVTEKLAAQNKISILSLDGTAKSEGFVGLSESANTTVKIKLAGIEPCEVPFSRSLVPF
jgi:hypothetical protein